MTAELVSQSAESATPVAYDAFLSYTHRDRPIATGVQRGLHQVGRRLGALRALRVFRDDTNLEVSPDLWGRITDAMDRSRYLVVVLSPNASGSYWVNREVQYWLEHCARDRLLVVLGGGRLQWDAEARRFDPDGSDASVPVLTEPGVLTGEPLIIDIGEDSPWDPKGALREKITALAAPVHGQTTDELTQLDRREQGRLRRLRNGAIAALALLTVVAMVLAGVAFVQNRHAIAQRNHAVALRLNTEAAAMLAQDQTGGDERAFFELLAARQIDSPADGALLDALALRGTTAKIIDTGHSTLLGAAVSPDGRIIATGGDDHTVRLWDTTTGRPAADPLHGHMAAIASLAFSPDGHRLASASSDLRLWDTRSWRPVGVPLVGYPGALVSLTVSPDEHHIASLGVNGNVRIWDTATGASRDIEPDGITGFIGQLAYSPDGSRLAWTATDAVHVVDTATGKETLSPFRGGQLPTPAVAFSHDGHQLATGSDTVRIWDADSGTLQNELGGFSGAAFAVAFSPDGRLLAGAGTDGAVRLWSVATGRLLSAPMLGHAGPVRQLTFTADGTRLVSASTDGSLRVWSLTHILNQGGEHMYVDVAFDPADHRIAGANSDGTVDIWDSDTDQVLHVLTAHPGGALAVDFSPDGHRLVSGGADGDLRLWNADTGAALGAPLHGDEHQVRAVAFSPDGHRLVSGGVDGDLRLWNADTGAALGAPLKGHDSTIYAVAFSPDGKLLLSGDKDGIIRVWDGQTGAPRSEHDNPTGGVTSIAFRPDGQRFAAEGSDAIVLWNTADLSPVGDPLAAPTTVAVAFSPDGHRLVSGGQDHTVRLWDADTGRPIGDPFTGHTGEVYGVEFSPDGRRVASASQDGTVRLWDAQADPELLCDKLTADITVDQWNQWIGDDIPYRPLCPNIAVTGKHSEPFSVLGVSGLDHPQAITAGRTGALYIADTKNNRVLRVTPGSDVAAELPFGDIQEPACVAVDDAGDVFVAAKDNAIYKLPAGATSSVRLMVPGLQQVGDIAAAADGTLYIGDRNRILKLAPGSNDPTVLELRPDANVAGVAVDRHGNVFASDYQNDEVIEISSGATQPIALPLSELSAPGGLTVGERGDVFVADTGNNRVTELPAGWPAGNELPFSGLQDPYAVTVGPTGDLYVVDAGNNRVVKLPAAED